jgi:hypothetical protein
MSETGVKRERWVYAGMTLDAKDKPVHVWGIVDPAVPLAEQPRRDPSDHTFERHAYLQKTRNLAPGRPGMVWDFDVERDDEAISVMTANREHVGTWPYADDVARWQLMTDHCHTALKRKRESRKERRRNHWQERLDPVRELYQSTRTVDRAAFLAQVIEYITRP